MLSLRTSSSSSGSLVSFLTILILSISSLITPVYAASSELQYIAANGPGGVTTWLLENRRPALYTQNFGDCLGGSLLNVSRFDAAYYQDNMTVTFHLEGDIAISNLSLMMYIGVYAYGEGRFNLIFNPCSANIVSLCPSNASMPIEAAGIIPVDGEDVSGIIPIALQIPDFEGQAVLRIFDNATESEIGCYSAILSNGHTMSHPSVVGSILGIFTVVAIIASFATAIYGDHLPTTRVHHAHSVSVFVVFAVFHHIFFTGALSVNWPSVMPAFWSNFAWAGGMIYSRPMQNSINRLIGTNLGNTSEVGAAGAGASSDDVGGGYSISAIYKRQESYLFDREPGMLEDVYKFMERGQVDSINKRGLENASSGFTWYGVPETPGLPLPGNYSGFAGTLSSEDIPASNAFMTGFIWLLIATAIVVGCITILKFSLEGLSRFKRIRENRLMFFRQHWKGFVAVAVLRTLFIAFFMMLFLSIFELAYHGPAGVTVVAVIIFLVFFIGILGVAAYAVKYRFQFGKTSTAPDRIQLQKRKLGILPWFGLTRTSHQSEKQSELPSMASLPWWRINHFSEDPRRVEVHQDEDFNKRFGWLTARYRKSRWWFFAIWLVYEFVRACFYGGAASQPATQVFGLLVVEFIGFLGIVFLKPFEGQRLNVIMVWFLGISKIASLAIAAVFQPRFNIPRIIATALGIIIIVIQGLLTVALLILIVIGATSSYFSVTRDSEKFSPKSWIPLREKYFDHINKAAIDRPPTPPARPESPKEPFFNVGSVRRLPKIEDEDPDEYGSDTKDLVGTMTPPFTATPQRQSRADSMRSISSNLPYGARPHRQSWSSRDFNSWHHSSSNPGGDRNSGLLSRSGTMPYMRSDASLRATYERAIKPGSRSNSMPLEVITKVNGQLDGLQRVESGQVMHSPVNMISPVSEVSNAGDEITPIGTTGKWKGKQREVFYDAVNENPSKEEIQSEAKVPKEDLESRGQSPEFQQIGGSSKVMKGVIRKLEVVAGPDSLYLLPPTQARRNVPSLQIQYGSGAISPLPAPASQATPKPSPKSAVTLEAHGIVGLFQIAGHTYLIVISQREQVAQTAGKAIYMITGVAIVPTSSQAEAAKVLQQTNDKFAKAAAASAAGGDATTDDEATSDDEGHEDGAPSPTSVTAPSLADVETPPSADQSASPAGQDVASVSQGSIAEDVLRRKGKFGRFGTSWFSKQGWTAQRKASQAIGDADEKLPNKDEEASTVEESKELTAEEGKDSASSALTAADPNPTDAKASLASPSPADSRSASLLPKLLSTTERLFCSQNMFFSYEWDLTRRIGTQIRTSDIALCRACDETYFWNRSLVTPLMKPGYYAFVLPIVQGFVGQRAFTVNLQSNDPSKTVAAVKEDAGEIIELQDNASNSKDFKATDKTRDFLITLISRRSTKRAGLRYLRRGVDDQGNTANAVETEQILSSASWSTSQKVYSYNQYRGSIPVFFSQQPYSFKPIPLLQHSYELNHAAFRRHIKDLQDQYGKLQLVALVNKDGSEAKIGEEYEKHAKAFIEESNGPGLAFEWFDFHNVCRGMRFDKVSLLVDTLEPQLKDFGYTIERDGKVEERQSGVVRTNCMDCLDRTNVVQSALAAAILERQLAAEGVTLDLSAGNTAQWFNTLFADNGDALSAQYTGTNALKGDYTRTRKRDYKGALNDFGLTLNRYYNNIVTDYFNQAAIDFLLGNVTEQVFEEYEANLSSDVPAMSLQKIRQHAIETSTKIVIRSPSEEVIGAWTLLSPKQFNTVRTYPFEESVLLLTDAALYAVRFDWNTEKVSSFERVDLKSVVGILHGTYITSTFTSAQMDEQRNVGFVIKYRPCKEDVVRVNTRSMSTAPTPGKEEFEALEKGEDNQANPRNTEESQAEKPTESPKQEVENPIETSNPAASSTTSTAITDYALHPAAELLASSLPSRTKEPDLKILAFKALPSGYSASTSSGANAEVEAQISRMPPSQQIKTLCDEIQRAVPGVVKAEGFVDKGDIIGLAQAKKSTGLVEQWGYSLKRLVWA
ncbi:hypothetical protein MMC25_005200 [Agyrium rufum]|nr:hypothetical protein [Agyrium rufum]